MLDHGKRTLIELHDAWWEVHSPNLARATREAYEGAWRKLIEPRLGKLRLSEITPLALEQFMRSLVAFGVGEASAEKAWVVLSSMLGRAEAWGWMARNPVRAARRPRKQKSGLNVVEVAARLGHSPSVCLGTYAHVFEELGAGAIDPEHAILAARLKLGAKQVFSRGPARPLETLCTLAQRARS
jgi:Phage integrase, N-terminal SAM-like domain